MSSPSSPGAFTGRRRPFATASSLCLRRSCRCRRRRRLLRRWWRGCFGRHPADHRRHREPHLRGYCRLPAPGLSLDPASGEISGTPTASGTFTFTVTVSDPNPNVPAVSRQFTLTVQFPVPLPAPPTLLTCGPKASTSSPATTAPTT
nr:Ig domain-containing protein [Streptomyces mirabilis]